MRVAVQWMRVSPECLSVPVEQSRASADPREFRPPLSRARSPLSEYRSLLSAYRWPLTLYRSPLTPIDDSSCSTAHLSLRIDGSSRSSAHPSLPTDKTDHIIAQSATTAAHSKQPHSDANALAPRRFTALGHRAAAHGGRFSFHASDHQN